MAYIICGSPWPTKQPKLIMTKKPETIAEPRSLNATNHKNSPELTTFAASDVLSFVRPRGKTWIVRRFLFCIPETFACQPHFLLDDEHDIISVLVGF